MATLRVLKIGAYLLGVVLVSAATIATGAAEEPAAGTMDGGGAATEGNHLGAKDVKSGGTGSFGPIDTRITVQVRRPGNGADKAQAAKSQFRFGTPMNSLHGTSVPRPSGSLSRNAIGLPAQERTTVPQSFRPAAAGGPATAAQPTTIRVGSFGSGTEGPNGLAPGRVGSGQAIAPGSSHGTINGTDMIHPGLALSRVGGPAKPVAGINGTTFRPKR